MVPAAVLGLMLTSTLSTGMNISQAPTIDSQAERHPKTEVTCGGSHAGTVPGDSLRDAVSLEPLPDGREGRVVLSQG